jgi:predicted  nucleic acid-binding Zn-ribbon protein
MNKNLELLLRLEELVLLRQTQQRMGEANTERTELDERIDQARRRLPGPILSAFDQLARQYANTVVPVVGQTCQGCQQPLPGRLARLLNHSSQVFHCGHCGRFLIMPEHLPDYLA